jgi:proline iminopeptidase
VGRIVAAIAIGTIAGLTSGVVAVAFHTSTASYLAAVLTVGIAATSLSSRWSAPGARRPAAIVVVSVLLLAIAAPRPFAAGPDNPRGPSLLVGADRDVFAYQIYNADPLHATTPLVFLHGGPGVSTRAQDGPWLAGLSRERTVIAYDQLGAGGSGRLPDPTGYSLEQTVQHLEQFRTSFGIDRMVLVGHSWGAVVAANYTAQHPDRVEALVALSPGSLEPGAEVADDPAVRLAGRDRVRLLSRVLRPRELYTYTLASIDPVSSHRIAGDAEMDRRYDQILEAVWPAMFCKSERAARHPPPSGGFYAHRQLQDLSTPEPTAPTGADPPRTLVVKPQCDYLSWSVVEGYVKELDAQVAYVADAGHAVHVEQRDVVADLVEGFLRGQASAAILEDPLAAPSSYQGPP